VSNNVKRSVFFLFIVLLLTSCTALPGKQGKADYRLIKAYKRTTERNPILTHTFGADPFILVYNERVYIYMTGDVLEYNNENKIITNSYNNINTIRIVSSADLANWTYHEPVKAAGTNGIAKWASRSWAPAAAYKHIDGADKFFLYFSDNANGVGVLTADSPTGPWTDPLGKALISRHTPNCNIPWVFDPAVLIDDDGKGYLYFGGGIPQGMDENPGSARVVMLNDDMISLAGDPIKIDAPFFFEDSGINKINGKYIYSYCTNWGVTDSGRKKYGIDKAVIAIMSSDSPLGPFTSEGMIFRNPGTFFGLWGNNHHALFEFKGNWYLAYHTQVLEEAMGIHSKGYRVTHIDSATIKDGKIQPITGTRRGVRQIEPLNPFIWQSGAISGISAGLTFASIRFTDTQEILEYADITRNGSWIGIFGADFGEPGAAKINVSLRTGQTDKQKIEVRLGSPSGEIIGIFTEPVSPVFTSYTIELSKKVKNIHDVYFIFSGGTMNFAGWQFLE